MLRRKGNEGMREHVWRKGGSECGRNQRSERGMEGVGEEVRE